MENIYFVIGSFLASTFTPGLVDLEIRLSPSYPHQWREEQVDNPKCN